LVTTCAGDCHALSRASRRPINIVENLDLEELAATARRLNRYEFALTFALLPVEGGTGSPVNPLAMF
jgi:hypothetical protein